MDKQWFKQIPVAEMISWRRYLHQHPELSFHEVQTSAYIVEKLQSFGHIKVEHPTKTSVLGTIQGAYPGKKILIRADIDALPVQEETGLPFSSENNQVMHACGHDTHMAILLASAKVLSQMAGKLHGSVQVLFQHAEELPPGGAREIVASGALHDLDAVIGLHIFTNIKSGLISIVPQGPASTSSDTLNLTIHGQSTHGSMPQKGIDPIIVGTQIVNQFQTIISRCTPPGEMNVISVCEFHAGDAENIIPQSAHLTATIRCVREATCQKIAQLIKTMIKNTCQSYGATPEIDYLFAYKSVVNDPKLSKLVKQSAQEVVGIDQVIDGTTMTASEDYSAYEQLAPSCFIILGGGDAEEGYGYVNHHAKFTINEDALVNGVKTEVAAVLKFLNSESE